MKTPPGFSECLLRRNECLPTESKTTSYVLPFFVKSSLLVVDDEIGAERPHEVDVLPVAHGRNLGAEVLR